MSFPYNVTNHSNAVISQLNYGKISTDTLVDMCFMYTLNTSLSPFDFVALCTYKVLV